MNKSNTQSTIKLNNDRLNRLKKLSNTDDLLFINDVEKTTKMIKDKYNNLNSQLSYLSSIMTYVRDTLKNKELLKKYNAEHKAIRNVVTSTLNNNVKSDNFIEWDDIIKYREELKTKAIDKKTYLNYLLLSLYTYNPPTRADYNNLLITKKNSTIDNNLLIKNKNSMKFNIKQHKTSKSNGNIIISVVGQLKIIMDHWLDNYQLGNVFLMMSNNKLVKLISDLLKKKFKRGSINVIRKSYLSHVYNNLDKYTNKELIDISNIMGNSPTTALFNYRKI